MKFTQEIVSQYILANGYEKPKIEIGNYYLKWNEKCYGIYPKEIVELKEFVTNVIPYFEVIYKLINSLERPRSKERFFLNKKLSPDIHFSHRNKEHLVSYDLHMMSDGATFIDRTEKIEIITKDYSTFSTGVNVAKGNFDKLELFLKSKLGQLLFNRQGKG
ncbi:MAG: hypothetical protein QOK72_08380 [Nitrososphaeraceae archaeon]|nr:hypothetical protein [Nitrososphaeraceae archaeon]